MGRKVKYNEKRATLSFTRFATPGAPLLVAGTRGTGSGRLVTCAAAGTLPAGRRVKGCRRLESSGRTYQSQAYMYRTWQFRRELFTQQRYVLRSHKTVLKDARHCLQRPWAGEAPRARQRERGQTRCRGFVQGRNRRQREQTNWNELYMNLDESRRPAIEQKKPDTRGTRRAVPLV